jgi:L-threonylcarbamoyladenylate synthase
MKKQDELSLAAKILKSGGIVIFPTDTVYGIGCRCDNGEAVDRIYKLKARPQDQPFPHLVSGTFQVEKMANITPLSKKFMDKYWPGALTIILDTKSGQKIGFRMPDNQDLLYIIDKVGVPIIGTSANFHTQPSPKSYGKLDPKLKGLADYVLKGQCEKGVESTVIDLTVNPPLILRRGAVKIKI